jgi:TRAP-type C4-dicarboxylate transport system permease small subunit
LSFDSGSDGLTLAEIGRQCINLVRPQWTRFLSAARLVIYIAGLVICYSLLKAGDLVNTTDAARSLNDIHTREWWVVGISITLSLYLALILTGIVSAFAVLREFWQLIRSGYKGSAVKHVN